MQLETGNNVNNYQLSVRLILREPGAARLGPDMIARPYSVLILRVERLEIFIAHVSERFWR